MRLMRESTQPVDRASIWAGQETFSCPGRVRNDTDNPARKNVFPGYIYSDEAYSHLTFELIGSRLKPGCAEGRIISTAIDLMRRSEGRNP